MGVLMTLFAPIHYLKRKARLMSRERNIPLYAALDEIAASEGFASWSLLANRVPGSSRARDVFSRLGPSDLLLVGARPGQGKTLLSLELATEAMKAGHQSAFFSLEYREKDVSDRFGALGVDWRNFERRFTFDASEDIGANYIQAKLASAPPRTLAVINYLQILDQSRHKPELSMQVRALKSFAQARGLILVFLSQIDRSYDPSAKRFPDLDDVRLPNPLDLKLFSKACFLNNGEMAFRTVN
jgi:replicative DNA helicase